MPSRIGFRIGLDFPEKKVLILAIILSLLGILSMVLSVAGFLEKIWGYYLGTGIWCGIGVFLDGIAGIVASQHKSACSVKTFFFASLQACIFSFLMIILSAGGLDYNSRFYLQASVVKEDNKGTKLIHGCSLIGGFIQCTLAIVCAILCLKINRPKQKILTSNKRTKPKQCPPEYNLYEQPTYQPPYELPQHGYIPRAQHLSSSECPHMPSAPERHRIPSVLERPRIPTSVPSEIDHMPRTRRYRSPRRTNSELLYRRSLRSHSVEEAIPIHLPSERHEPSAETELLPRHVQDQVDLGERVSASLHPSYNRDSPAPLHQPPINCAQTRHSPQLDCMPLNRPTDALRRSYDEAINLMPASSCEHLQSDNGEEETEQDESAHPEMDVTEESVDIVNPEPAQSIPEHFEQEAITIPGSSLAEPAEIIEIYDENPYSPNYPTRAHNDHHDYPSMLIDDEVLPSYADALRSSRPGQYGYGQGDIRNTPVRRSHSSDLRYGDNASRTGNRDIREHYKGTRYHMEPEINHDPYSMRERDRRIANASDVEIQSYSRNARHPDRNNVNYRPHGLRVANQTDSTSMPKPVSHDDREVEKILGSNAQHDYDKTSNQDTSNRNIPRHVSPQDSFSGINSAVHVPRAFENVDNSHEHKPHANQNQSAHPSLSNSSLVENVGLVDANLVLGSDRQKPHRTDSFTQTTPENQNEAGTHKSLRNSNINNVNMQRSRTYESGIKSYDNEPVESNAYSRSSSRRDVEHRKHPVHDDYHSPRRKGYEPRPRRHRSVSHEYRLPPPLHDPQSHFHRAHRYRVSDQSFQRDRPVASSTLKHGLYSSFHGYSGQKDSPITSPSANTYNYPSHPLHSKPHGPDNRVDDHNSQHRRSKDDSSASGPKSLVHPNQHIIPGSFNHKNKAIAQSTDQKLSPESSNIQSIMQSLPISVSRSSYEKKISPSPEIRFQHNKLEPTVSRPKLTQKCDSSTKQSISKNVELQSPSHVETIPDTDDVFIAGESTPPTSSFFYPPERLPSQITAEEPEEKPQRHSSKYIPKFIKPLLHHKHASDKKADNSQEKSDFKNKESKPEVSLPPVPDIPQAHNIPHEHPAPQVPGHLQANRDNDIKAQTGPLQTEPQAAHPADTVIPVSPISDDDSYLFSLLSRTQAPSKLHRNSSKRSSQRGIMRTEQTAQEEPLMLLYLPQSASDSDAVQDYDGLHDDFPQSFSNPEDIHRYDDSDFPVPFLEDIFIPGEIPAALFDDSHLDPLVPLELEQSPGHSKKPGLIRQFKRTKPKRKKLTIENVERHRQMTGDLDPRSRLERQGYYRAPLLHGPYMYCDDAHPALPPHEEAPPLSQYRTSPPIEPARIQLQQTDEEQTQQLFSSIL